MLLVFFCTTLQAETYIREYTYKASEADSKLSSRMIALDQVKVLLLQEIGTHIRQKINITKDGSGSTYASEDVEAITAGLTKVDVLEEKWNGETYYLKAKVEADTQRVLDAIEEYKKSDSNEKMRYIESLKSNERELKKTRDENRNLREQLKQVNAEKQKQIITTKYKNNLNKLSVSPMFIKGWVAYEQGDYNGAIYWYKKAAELEYAPAQFNLAVMYFVGWTGVIADYNKSFYWMRKAADQGYTDAIFSVGGAYEAGRGVKQDYVRAAFWYKQAAVQGDKYAQGNLARLYLNGKGVPKNEKEAAYWYIKAANQGNASAYNQLAAMYSKGIGVTKNEKKAAYWRRKGTEERENIQRLIDHSRSILRSEDSN
jgi:TPR repeat protein